MVRPNINFSTAGRGPRAQELNLWDVIEKEGGDLGVMGGGVQKSKREKKTSKLKNIINQLILPVIFRPPAFYI